MQHERWLRWVGMPGVLGAGMAWLALASAAGPTPAVPPKGPLSPREELATFRVRRGFRVELVASEPDVIDPVAMAFDEDGRLFVAEMRGYPNGGVATGTITSGRSSCWKTATATASTRTARSMPTVCASRRRSCRGRAACWSPMRRTSSISKTPRATARRTGRRILYTGFDLANIQQLVNSLQWGLDNWVYGCAGSDGGTIRLRRRSRTAPAVTLRGRGIRFHPEMPGSLEPTSGGGQYGLAADDWGHWFTATNSQHLRHIVLPDHYLRRNPFLPVSAVTLDIPDHGAGRARCIASARSRPGASSAPRAARAGPDAKRFPPTELVPGGYITSACSPVVYAADLFPAAYRGNTFVCDPANNLIHRDVLVPSGATFIAQRGDADCEFLASTDNWFRPVNLTIGPDGALYVLDFYREVIETPLSLPDDIKKKLNLESRGRGRIWRIVPRRGQGRQRTAAGRCARRRPRNWSAPGRRQSLVAADRAAAAGRAAGQDRRCKPLRRTGPRGRRPHRPGPRAVDAARPEGAGRRA